MTKSYTIKKVERCVDCNRLLRKNHKHHFRCGHCWYKFHDIRNGTANDMEKP